MILNVINLNFIKTYINFFFNDLKYYSFHGIINNYNFLFKNSRIY